MSNHIADASKMVDTPRTDAKRSGENHFMGDWVDANFACQLERELNSANAEVERLTAKVAQLYEGVEEQKQRIQRLEEAGDAMINEGWNEPHLANAWRKAKEAKP